MSYPQAKGNPYMKRVLALQFIWDDPPGYLGEIMQEHDILCEVINVEEAPVPDPTEYDAFIAMGGPQHVGDNDKYPYLVGVESAIRRAVEKDIPYLGLCLGGQLLAHALGAPVKRHSIASIGFYEVQLTEEGKADPLFRGLPGYQQVIHWHEDTFDIPKDAIQLATNERTENQAFRYGRLAYGTQYHIELTPSMLDIWIHHPDYRQEIVNTLGETAADKFISDRPRLYPLYREHTRIMFENFLRIGGLIP
jgi:GMP synthase-like glutamine amidotransferase